MLTFWKSTMTLGCALPFAINVTHYVSMTVEVTCFLFHSLTFLLSDSRHPVKQALFHALSCLLSVRVKDLKSPEIKIFIFHFSHVRVHRDSFTYPAKFQFVTRDRFRGRHYLIMFRKFIRRLGAISKKVTHNVRSQFVPINQVSCWSLSIFSNTISRGQY